MGNNFDKISISEKSIINSDWEKSIDTSVRFPGSYKVKAKCNYKANGKVNDISFRKNEIMYVIWKYNDTWLEVVKENNKIHGLVPSHLVIKLDESPQSVEGWRNIVRREAKYLLLNSELKRGTYILRPSSKKSCYALSVRDYDKKKSDYVVKNFLIRTIQTEKGEEYSTHIRFYPNISLLINYFTIHGIGINHTRLTDPIPNYYQSIQNFNQQKLNLYSQTFNNNLDNLKLKNSLTMNEEKQDRKSLGKNNFILIVKLKIKCQCRQISNFFEKCTKSRNPN